MNSSDDAWLAGVGRVLGSRPRIVARAPLAGGYVASSVERIDLDIAGRAVSVVRKVVTPGEVAAMRALAVVRDVARGRWRSGPTGWCCPSPTAPRPPGPCPTRCGRCWPACTEPAVYRELFDELRPQARPPAELERSWGDVHVNVQYLALAADHLSDHGKTGVPAATHLSHADHPDPIHQTCVTGAALLPMRLCARNDSKVHQEF